MGDLLTLLTHMVEEGVFTMIGNNPLAQFGTPRRPFLGAQFLPERLVDENSYEETGIRYRTIVATDKTRYSPVELRNGKMTGSMKVSLSESGTGDQFTARDYDVVVRALGRAGGDVQAQANLIRWTDMTLLQPLVVKCEVKRWQRFADTHVRLRGANGYVEDVPNPLAAGQRVTVGGDWSDPDYDPILDIYERVSYQAAKGYTVTRIVSSTAAVNKLLANPKVAARFGRVIVGPAGSIGSASGRPTLANVNQMLGEDGIPAIEKYDRMYQTATGTERFLAEDAMIFFSETDNEEQIDNPDAEPIIVPSTLGYYAIGTCPGQPNPGRVIEVTPGRNLPPRLEGESTQTEYPVVLDPEGHAVLVGI